MRTFSIEGGMNSPSVFIDESNNMIEISGNSTLRETNWFYPNVFRWMVALNNNLVEKRTINVKLKSVNDSSSQWLTIIFQKLSGYHPCACFEINWYVNDNNSRASALVQRLQCQSGLKVNIIY
jgi:hypothetical protein